MALFGVPCNGSAMKNIPGLHKWLKYFHNLYNRIKFVDWNRVIFER